MRKIKTLTAKNPSEARGIRKALKAVGMKYEFKAMRPGRRKRNPAKKKGKKKTTRRRSSRSLSRRR
jgi:hypothetical protein